MGLTEYTLSQALLIAVKHVDKSGIVLKTAQQFDELADLRLGRRGSDAVQERLVMDILLPLCRELMAEDRQRYVALLEKEQMGFNGYAQRAPERGTVRDIVEDDHNRVHGKGQNFQPKL